MVVTEDIPIITSFRRPDQGEGVKWPVHTVRRRCIHFTVGSGLVPSTASISARSSRAD